MLTKEEQVIFEAVKNSELANCFVPVDGQELRPDSLFFVKAGADVDVRCENLLGSSDGEYEDGAEKWSPAFFKINLAERLALGTNNTAISLRGDALNKNSPHTLKMGDNGEGYMYLGSKRMSRIFYSTFFGDIPDGLEIDHMNHDRADNRLTNMRLVSHSENCKNRQSPQHRNKWSDDDSVMLIPRRSGYPVLIHPSGVRHIVQGCNVWKLLHGDRATVKGWYAIVNPDEQKVLAYFTVFKDLNRKGLKEKCLALLGGASQCS